MQAFSRFARVAFVVLSIFLPSWLAAADSGSRTALDARVRQELAVDRFERVELQLPSTERPAGFSLVVERAGQRRAFALHRHSVRSPDFRLRVQRAGGELIDEPAPPGRVYRGRSVGAKPATIAASLLDDGVVATVIEDEGGMWSLYPLRRIDGMASRATHVIFDESERPSPTCGVDHAATPDIPPVTAELPDGSGSGADDCSLHVAEIGFDSDYEFFAEDGDGDTDTCMEIVEQGLNVTDAMYVRDVKITHRMSTLVLRTDPATDFWSQFPDSSDFGAMLRAFRSEWNDNMGDVDYDVAYYMTGKGNPEYGGLAYVGVVCSSSRYGMGLAGRGYDRIFRHELGHNWGASHSCGEERRFIMCGNSISAISAYNMGVMSRHRDSRSCLDVEPYDPEPAAPFVRLDLATLPQGGGPVSISVVAGDSDPDCDRLRLARIDERSAFGASLFPSDAGSPDEPLRVLYVPRSDFGGTDYFSYTIADESGFRVDGRVLVSISAPAMLVRLPFDETSGDETEDVSGFGHDGELRADMTFDAASVEGRFGRALGFDGTDGQYVSLGSPSRLSIRRAITISAWLRVDAFTGSGESLVGKGSDAYHLERNGTSGRLRFRCAGVTVSGGNNGAVPGTIAVDDGEWHHAVGVYDGSSIRLYIDGALDRDLPASGLINTNSGSVRIGDNQWPGPIDEVRIYDWGLSDEEVAALYNDARVENADPAHGSTGTVPGSPFVWLPAAEATLYDVYVGDDEEAVRSGDTRSPEYAGRTRETVFTPDVNRGATFWWRVDPVSGGVARRGVPRRFSTSFAYTNFDEPETGARSYRPRVGDSEIGFTSTSRSTGGDGPLLGVVGTSSTPSTPVFAHRSLAATTTFDTVDLSEYHGSVVSFILQARSTDYEDEDSLAAWVDDGEQRIDLLRLDDPISLTQRAGTGYHTYAAAIPADWESGRLVVDSSSNSGSGSERFDFDRIGFSCHKLFRVVARTLFDEASPGAGAFTPGPGDEEIGFETRRNAADGVNPRNMIVDASSLLPSKYLSHRSVTATTTFDPVDVRAHRDVRVTVTLRVLDTGYEQDDSLRVSIHEGAQGVDLVNINGDNGLDSVANDRYLSYWTTVPGSWETAQLVIATSSDSSAGSEGFDVRLVEFVSRHTGDPCSEEEPPEPVEVFRRGDTNGDGAVDISDGIQVLNFLFVGGGPLECVDAADTDDSGDIDLSDGITTFNYLFLGGSPPSDPGVDSCGADPGEDDGLDCVFYGACG